jgi:hypothetical protein
VGRTKDSVVGSDSDVEEVSNVDREAHTGTEVEPSPSGNEDSSGDRCMAREVGVEPARRVDPYAGHPSIDAKD